MSSHTTPTGTYDYNGTELTSDECPPEGQNLTAWITTPWCQDGQALVDLRTVPNDVLEQLYDEAGAAGDYALVETLRDLLP